MATDDQRPTAPLASHPSAVCLLFRFPLAAPEPLPVLAWVPQPTFCCLFYICLIEIIFGLFTEYKAVTKDIVKIRLDNSSFLFTIEISKIFGKKTKESIGSSDNLFMFISRVMQPTFVIPSDSLRWFRDSLRFLFNYLSVHGKQI